MKLLLFALALPLAAEPLYTLYDCTDRTAACESAFPGERAQRLNSGQFQQNGRTVVDGIDLGPARTGVPGDPSFDAIYRRGEWVIGWRYCCDEDEDGWLVKWQLGEGSAEYSEYPDMHGARPYYLDVNINGMVLGFDPYHETPFYDTAKIPLGPSATEIPPQYLREDGVFNQTVHQMYRINDAGQALFTTIPRFGDPVETLFLFSPNEVPFPVLVHQPEPGTWVMMGLGVAVLIYGKRRRSRDILR